MPHILVLCIHQEDPCVEIHLVFVFVLGVFVIYFFAMNSKFLQTFSQLYIVRAAGCYSDDIFVEMRKKRFDFLGGVSFWINRNEDDF